MIPSITVVTAHGPTVYQRGWMIDSQHASGPVVGGVSISKGMDD